MSGHHKLHPSFKDEGNGKILPYDFFKDKEYEQEVKKKMESKESDFDVQTKLWDLTDQDDIKKLYCKDFCVAENRKQGRYISDNIVLEFQKQIGNTCISTCLAILIKGLSEGKTDTTIQNVRLSINTQSPRTWSAALENNTGYKLAYCNFDRRYIEHYLKELKEADDLFLVSWYSSKDNFGTERDGRIWTGGSHVVICYRGEIFDTNAEESIKLDAYFNSFKENSSVKRIFRVVAPWSNHRL